MQWFLLRSITRKTTFIEASCVRRNPISFHQQASFPNPKGRKLPPQVQNFIYSLEGPIFKSTATDFGAICLKKNWNFFATKVISKQYLKIPIVWVAAKIYNWCILYISARVWKFSQKKFQFFSKEIQVLNFLLLFVSRQTIGNGSLIP